MHKLPHRVPVTAISVAERALCVAESLSGEARSDAADGPQLQLFFHGPQGLFVFLFPDQLKDLPQQYFIF